MVGNKKYWVVDLVCAKWEESRLSNVECARVSRLTIFWVFLLAFFAAFRLGCRFFIEGVSGRVKPAVLWGGRRSWVMVEVSCRVGLGVGGRVGDVAVR